MGKCGEYNIWWKACEIKKKASRHSLEQTLRELRELRFLGTCRAFVRINAQNHVHL